MIIAKIDVTKIDKDHLFTGAKGKYLDLVLMENRDGKDRFENDGMVVQGVSKEARAKGVKGPIVGNYRIVQTRQGGPKRSAGGFAGKPPGAETASNAPDTEDDVPF